MYHNSHYTQLNLLLPPSWLTLTLCPSTQHRRLADWSRDRQAGAVHVTTTHKQRLHYKLRDRYDEQTTYRNISIGKEPAYLHGGQKMSIKQFIKTLKSSMPDQSCDFVTRFPRWKKVVVPTTNSIRSAEGSEQHQSLVHERTQTARRRWQISQSCRHVSSGVRSHLKQESIHERNLRSDGILLSQ